MNADTCLTLRQLLLSLCKGWNRNQKPSAGKNHISCWGNANTKLYSIMFLIIRVRLSSYFKWCWPAYKYFCRMNYATGSWIIFRNATGGVLRTLSLSGKLMHSPSRAYISSNHSWKVLDTVEGETPNLCAKSSVWMFSFISTSSNSSVRLSLVGLCTNGHRKLRRAVGMRTVVCRIWSLCHFPW